MPSKKRLTSPYTEEQCAAMHLYYLGDIREIALGNVFRDRDAVNASVALHCAVRQYTMRCGYIPVTSSASGFETKWFDICYTCADGKCPARYHFMRSAEDSTFELTQVLEHTCRKNYCQKPHRFGKLLATLFAPEYFKCLRITRRDARAVLRRWKARGIPINIPRGYDVLHGMMYLFRHTNHLVEYIKRVGIKEFNEDLKAGCAIPKKKSLGWMNGFDYSTLPPYWPRNPDRLVAPDERRPPDFHPCSDSSDSFDPMSELMFSDTSESVGSSDVSDVSTFEESSDSFCEDDSQRHFWNKAVDRNENTEHRTGNNNTTEKKVPRLEFPDFQFSKQSKKGIDESTDQILERERIEQPI